MKAKDIVIFLLVVLMISIAYVYQGSIMMKYFQIKIMNENDSDFAKYQEEKIQIRQEIRNCEMKLLQMEQKNKQDSFQIHHNASSSSSTSSSSSSSSISQFDIIAKTLYNQAIMHPKTPSSSKRKPFSLKHWTRGNGGLDDQDRLALGELYLHANSVFEFGLGESTYIAAAVSVPRYAGVDSDANWVSDARNNAAMMNAKHFRFYFADVGKTLAWGLPAETLDKNLYDYQVQSLDAEKEAFDVYYVDGRYRVACACVSFLHAMKHGADMSKVRVGTHDNERADYHVLQEIGDVVVQNTKLWVYKLKDGITEDDIAKLYDKSMEDTHR